MLYHLAYTSTETGALTDNDLLEMLDYIRAANEKQNVTGLLLHRQNCFFQVLEGKESVVRKLYEQIASDVRHHRVELLFEGPIEDREFTDWRMGFVQLDNVDATQYPGFSRFLENNPDHSWTMFHEMSKTQRLMSLFRDMV